MKGRPKVLVIGLDGATWDLIKPWAEERKLPNIKQLMYEGVWEVLESTIPSNTGPAWTSLTTKKERLKLKIKELKLKGKIQICGEK